MSGTRTSLFAGICLVLSSHPALAAGPAEEYIDAQLKVVRSLEQKTNLLADAAEEAAARLLQGGSIYLSGERGMVLELLGRAGGLCAAKELNLSRPLPGLAGDVVLWSDYGGPRTAVAGLDTLAGRGALVIAFASSDHPRFGRPLPAGFHAIPVEIPRDSRLLAIPSGRESRILPTAAPAIAIAEWAYVAELIGACRRRHKQLAVYLSIYLDEGLRRFRRTQGLLFEPGLRPDAAPRGEYAGRFLAHVRESLEGVRREDLEKIPASGGMASRCGGRTSPRGAEPRRAPSAHGAGHARRSAAVHRFGARKRRRGSTLDPAKPPRGRRVPPARLSAERGCHGRGRPHDRRPDHFLHFRRARARPRPATRCTSTSIPTGCARTAAWNYRATT